MSKKMKWAYRALRAGDAADAVLEFSPSAIAAIGIMLIILMAMGIDPLTCIAVFAVIAVALFAVALLHICSMYVVNILGFTEEGLEREALG